MTKMAAKEWLAQFIKGKTRFTKYHCETCKLWFAKNATLIREGKKRHVYCEECYNE